MKIALVYFTFNKDEDLLELSLKSVERLKVRGYNIDVYIANDINNPINKIFNNCKYINTSFDRKGNLHGMQCVAGMIDVMTDIAKCGYDWICKIDSDVILNSLSELQAVDFQKYAQFGFQSLNYPDKCVCIGAFRAYSQLGIANMKFTPDRIDEILSNLWYKTRYNFTNAQLFNNVAEDHVICKLACLNNQTLNKFNILKYNNPYIEKENNCAYCDFKLDELKKTFIKNIPVKKLLDYQMIFFKDMINQNNVKSINLADAARLASIKRIKQYIELLETYG